MRNIFIGLMLLLTNPIFSQNDNKIQIQNIGLYSNTPYRISPQLADKVIGKNDSQLIENDDECFINFILSQIDKFQLSKKSDIDVRIIMKIKCDDIKKTIYMDLDLAYIDGIYYTIPFNFYELLSKELNVNLD